MYREKNKKPSLPTNGGGGVDVCSVRIVNKRGPIPNASAAFWGQILIIIPYNTSIWSSSRVAMLNVPRLLFAWRICKMSWSFEESWDVHKFENKTRNNCLFFFLPKWMEKAKAARRKILLSHFPTKKTGWGQNQIANKHTHTGTTLLRICSSGCPSNDKQNCE